MIINLIYDTFALAAPQSFRDGMTAAANLLSAAIHDIITINIDVGYGEFNGQPLPNQNTSEGGDSGFSITYSNLRALLASHETSAADITSVNALPSTTTLNGQSDFVIGTAEARALGALAANSGTVDGTVGMGRNFTGSVLVGGALHELTHAMGRVPGASGLSLVRYTSQGNHLFTGGPPATASYFSIDGGVTKLADFGVSSDPSDFLNSPASSLTPNDPFDETIVGSTLTSVDLTMMDVLGFNVTSNPPPSPPPPPPPGSQDVFFAPGQPINVVTSTTGTNLPMPVSGQFNLELIINATGTGSSVTAPGYQGVAIISTDSHTLTLLHGNYGVVDTGGHQTIIAGDGSESIGGAAFDTILGGNGANQFLDGHAGNQSITGGSAGNETIWGAATDTVRGGSGGNETIGGVSGETIVGSSGANLFINATGGGQSIVGGNAGNATVWTASGDTIRGGGGNETIGGVAGVTMIGGTGGNQFLDASQGHESILGGSGGNETIWGALTDTVRGGSGGNETIGGVAGETILGGAANTFINATGGSDSILAGTGNTTIWGGAHDTVQGISGGGSGLVGFAGGNETFWDDGATTGRQDSISTFNQAAGDRVSLNGATDDPNTLVVTATNDGGNAVLHLHDGSSITLIGITTAQLNTGFFTTH
jgi:hypothetical protein